MGGLTTTIVPGFAEGTWHTSILQKELDKLGYRENPIAKEADIIISHSAGCLFLPNSPKNNLVICINPPYWPGRPLAFSSAQKIFGDFVTAKQRGKLGFWAAKHTMNIIYIWLNLMRVVLIARGASQRKFYEALRHKRVAIIRNDDDAWLSPTAKQTMPTDMDFKFYRMPGQHEDCWVYPADYARLIDQIVKDLYRAEAIA